MLRQGLVLVLSAGLMMSVGGCTSKKAAEQEQPADVAEVASDTAPAAGDEVAASGDAAVQELGTDELSAEEKLPEEGGAAPEQAAQPTEQQNELNAATDELAQNPAAQEAQPPAEGEMAPPPSEPGLEPAPEAAPAPETMAGEPTPEPQAAPQESLAAGGMEAGAPTPAPEGEAKPASPLRKIADAPYKSGKTWVNAVYIARAGDTLDAIATKIYGSNDKVKELVKINPTFKGRDVKVGDKVYYNSPQRPDDNQKMMTYYEDMGLTPEVYVVNKPENIRKVAKKLLGDSASWKELWATNLELESKGELAEGTQLRYWASAPAAGAMAGVKPTEAPPPMESAPPPPPPTEMAQAAPPPAQPALETAPPPPPPDQSLAQNAPPPPAEAQSAPPPPPPASDLPPPPPPPAKAGAKHETPAAEPGPLAALGLEGQDQTMAMGAGAIILLGAVMLFIMIRKRKSRRNIDFHTSTQTQIE